VNVLGNIAGLGSKTLERLLGHPTFRFLDRDIVCIPSSLRRGTTLNIGGFDVEVTLSLLVRTEHFFQADRRIVIADGQLLVTANDMPSPVAGREIEFRGKWYRILTVTLSPAADHYEITLGDPER
jgi:hypothetical protein